MTHTPTRGWRGLRANSSVGQLAACGLSSAAISRRTRNGRLHRVHRGVYAVGHDALTLRASFVAAVLACGDGAALSYHSAAAQWGFLRWDERCPQVTVAGAQRRVAGLPPPADAGRIRAALAC